jgi:glycosyltransferase involved in cell wall biosynthesis
VSRRLRILEVFQPPDGGVPQHVRVLAAGLVARGHDVVVAGPADAAVRAAVERSGARFVPLEIVGDLAAPRQDLRTATALSRLLRRVTFDVVHCHGQKAGLLGRLAALGAGIPAVYTGHSFVYRTQRLRPRRSAALRYHATLKAERALGRRTAAIVAVAQEERSAVIRDGLAPPERVHVVYYGVAPDRDVDADADLLAFRDGGPLLGFVAGLRDQKGLPTLLEALELLAGRREAPRFAIVGNGPLRTEVERRVREGGLTTTTLLRPFEGRVEPYLAALDAFVLPSYWEGLPIAVLEAMAMGVPTVASAVNGTPEAIRDGETGLLVPPYDAPALADAIARLAGEPETRERLGAAARALAEERFGIERMVDELEALYEGAARPARG